MSRYDMSICLNLSSDPSIIFPICIVATQKKIGHCFLDGSSLMFFHMLCFQVFIFSIFGGLLYLMIIHIGKLTVHYGKSPFFIRENLL